MEHNVKFLFREDEAGRQAYDKLSVSIRDAMAAQGARLTEDMEGDRLCFSFTAEDPRLAAAPSSS